LREIDATMVSLLAYAGPRPEPEALPLTFEQVGRRTISFRATKSGVEVTQLGGDSVIVGVLMNHAAQEVSVEEGYPIAYRICFSRLRNGVPASEALFWER
jgi:hypothetical protein